MLAWLRQERRHAAVLEAEALVWLRGARGVALAHAGADDPHQDKERRRYYRLVAAIAKRRLAEVSGLNTATMFEVGNRWPNRPGQTIT